jgi:hypothetical protein
MFELTDEEDKRAKEWMRAQREEHPSESAAIGGRFTFTFTPTGIGVFAYVKDAATGESLWLNEDADW